MNHRTSVIMAVLIVAVVGVALMVGLSVGDQATNECKAGTDTQAYQVVIKAGKAVPDTIQGHLCDTLTITNKDGMAREIAFGSHVHHVPYDGVAERVLSQGQSLTITLNQTGVFHWHDHLHDEVQGNFTVGT